MPHVFRGDRVWKRRARFAEGMRKGWNAEKGRPAAAFVAKGPGQGIMMQKGGMVTLRPAVQADRRRFYDWLRRFDGTPAHDGLPDFEAFSGDEQDFFFDGSAPDLGRYFTIVDADGTDVGCISYTCFHLKPGVAEIDLWLADESLCSRGLGTAAIRTLLDRLVRELGIHTAIIRPSRENARAIRAYEKCGFSPMPGDISDYMLPQYLAPYGEGDFGEEGTVNLVLSM